MRDRKMIVDCLRIMANTLEGYNDEDIDLMLDAAALIEKLEEQFDLAVSTTERQSREILELEKRITRKKLQNSSLEKQCADFDKAHRDCVAVLEAQNTRLSKELALLEKIVVDEQGKNAELEAEVSDLRDIRTLAIEQKTVLTKLITFIINGSEATFTVDDDGNDSMWITFCYDFWYPFEKEFGIKQIDVASKLLKSNEEAVNFVKDSLMKIAFEELPDPDEEEVEK
jgi:hypothetical protein